MTSQLEFVLGCHDYGNIAYSGGLNAYLGHLCAKAVVLQMVVTHKILPSGNPVIQKLLGHCHSNCDLSAFRWAFLMLMKGSRFDVVGPYVSSKRWLVKWSDLCGFGLCKFLMVVLWKVFYLVLRVVNGKDYDLCTNHMVLPANPIQRLSRSCLSVSDFLAGVHQF